MATKKSEQVCCSMMRTQLSWTCPDHASAADCPDALVGRFGPNRHGIYVHDGGESFVEILFCPWCGSKLSSPSRSTKKA